MGQTSRYWEIDFCRGTAILMMVVFHVVFDLGYFGIFPVSASSGFWRYFGYGTASLFLLIVGVSFSIRYARVSGNLSGWMRYRKFLYRGIGIFALGLLVTLGTWLYLGEGFVLFGILHLIGISVIIAPFFYRFGIFNILLGFVCIAAGFFMGGLVGPLWLIPLGLHPAAFWSVDYTPLFPWFGIVLMGIGAGCTLYPGGIRRIPVPDLPPYGSSFVIFSGMHSLAIYLVHQPVILLVLQVITGRVLPG
jgi:Predicted membrane protein